MTSLVLTSSPSKNVVKITLNRPEKRNALSMELMQQLVDQLARVPASTRIVLLEGEGPFFCAGLDLAEGAQAEWREKTSELVSKSLLAIAKVPCATVAYVRGGAYAGGLGLMAACDLVIASREASFALPELRRGLIPALVHALLHLQVPERFLQEMILTGEAITAVRAHSIGLVNQVISHEEKDKVLKQLFDNILKAAPGALTTYKKDLLQRDKLEASFAQALQLHREVRNNPEAEEGLKAFNEKRHPSWIN